MKVKLVAVVILALVCQGCSVFMAAKQPKKKNLALLTEGTPRSEILAEFGAPEISETKDGQKYEIYKFVQGYSTGAKAGRAVFHGAADVFSLGLWEVVGTPTEAIFDGEEMAFEVLYDSSDRVAQVAQLGMKDENNASE